MFCRADRRPATEILSQGMIGLKVEPVLLALSVRFSHLRVRSDVSTDSSHKGSVMKLIKTTLVISALIFSTSGMAKGKAARKGGAVGAAVGAGAAAVTGKSVLKGAAVGAGTGALIGEATH